MCVCVCVCVCVDVYILFHQLKGIPVAYRFCQKYLMYHG